ncbi:hypothetical protein GCM10010313_25590 [Streptomyces violarus]|uniref:Uncharacterized protein n=1 Tax=Streptomyces violarus TaxID=67380 RepID=A0A7W4ZU85_9ACTN|nr:hypothetical protein [Streptomyces violarus]GHD06961.1 hypothetical protein GCM10010313_25590 [Streptomyces violarus]
MIPMSSPPAGPCALHDAQAALPLRNPAAQGGSSMGILRDKHLLSTVDLMQDCPRKP